MSVYNAFFSYGGRKVEVLLSSFSYSLTMNTKGKSQARQRFTTYPTRVVPSSLSIVIIFRNPEEYLSFGEFVRDYHLSVTSTGKPSDMLFVCDRIGVRYGVALDLLPMRFSYDMVAPTVPLTLKVLSDRNELSSGEPDSSDISGSEDDLVGPDAVSSSGDVSYSGNVSSSPPTPTNPGKYLR